MVWMGETHEGKHTPIVTRKLFEKVQMAMAERAKPRGPKLKVYTYRAFFHCAECGCFITTETQKGHNYLRCTKRVKRDCSQPYVREEEINRQVTEAVRLLSLSVEDADWMVGKLQMEQASTQQELASALSDANVTCRDIDEKLRLLTDAYLSRALPLDEYRETRARLIAQKQTAKDHVAALEASRGKWFEPAIRFVLAAKQATFLTETGSAQEKRDFLKKTVRTIFWRTDPCGLSPAERGKPL